MFITLHIRPNANENFLFLGRRTLAKQLVYHKRVIDSLEGSGKWVKHPTVRMWRGHVDACKHLFNEALSVWRRHFLFEGKVCNLVPYQLPPREKYFFPKWYGKSAIIYAHRGYLLRKYPKVYSKTWSRADSAGITNMWPSKRLLS